MSNATGYSIAKAVDLFLTHLEAKGRRPDTVQGYRRRLRYWRESEAMNGIEMLDDVTPEAMDAWAVSLSRPRMLYEGHDYREEQMGTYSKHTIAGMIGHVKTFLRFCYGRGYATSNPGKHLAKPSLAHQGRDKAMAMEDFKAMYQAAKELALDQGNPRDLALFSFIADTAARRGEVVALQLQDLQLADCVATVTGKTGARPVEFTEQTSHFMDVWLDFRKELQPAQGHDYVFVGLNVYQRSSFGQPLLPQAVNQIFRRLAARAGVSDRYNPHAVRHLIGKAWIDAGVNLELVRLKLGHADVGTTARFYANQDRARVMAATKVHSLLGQSNGHGPKAEE